VRHDSGNCYRYFINRVSCLAGKSNPNEPHTHIMIYRIVLLALVVLSFHAQLCADVLLTEFMALNQGTLVDDYGNHEDWIEVYNTGPTNVDLAGWTLTDSAGNLGKWTFPATNLPVHGFMVVFASNRDRRVPGAVLHTNFKLDGGGEYLALGRPDGTIATQFTPNYPAQASDVAFGLSYTTQTSTLITTGTVGRVRVPVDGSLATSWTSNAFNDLTWMTATNGIGFDTGTNEYGIFVPQDVLTSSPAGYWRLNESTNTLPATNIGTLGGSFNGQFFSGVTNNLAGPRPPGFTGFEASNTCSRFNGANGYLRIPYSPGLNPAGPFAVECWAKPATSGGSQCLVSSIGSKRGYRLYQNGTNRWEFYLGSDNTTVASVVGGAPQINIWAHLVGVFDGTNAMLYVNGLLAGMAAPTSAFQPNTSADLYVARPNGTMGSYYGGYLDEVAFFPLALSPSVVAQRYDLGASSAMHYSGVIQTDLRAAMHGVNGSVYFRLPFTLDEDRALDAATLRVKYDDGFKAYVNGLPVASANAPAEPTWNSVATARHPAVEALAFRSYDVTAALSSLPLNGMNLLALQGVNYAATNADFLLLPELELVTSGFQSTFRYFVLPTPGTGNGAGSADLGPILTSMGHFPNVPTTNDNITVTARVARALAPIGTVSLNWRVMYGAKNTAAMLDDGLHGDGAAGDGVYGAVINKTNYSSGQMVRWYVTAADTSARISRWPLYEDPLNSAEHLGTVVQTNYVTSRLPVIHLFASNNVVDATPPTYKVAADSEDGGRVSLFFNGEFYDNIKMWLRGNTTDDYDKKSHRFRFNDEQKFRHNEPGGRIKSTSFVADFADFTYLRQRISYWLYEQAGVTEAFYAPYRLQLNGSFYQLANHNDVLGDELLERLGYNPSGALYKAVGTFEPDGWTTGTRTGVYEKKTRLWDTDADYVSLANAINESISALQRKTNVFDRLDLPEVINYLVVARFIHECDDVEANMSVYHDNDGDDLWRIIPFDLNLTWGASYLDSAEYSGLQVTNDIYQGFPLYGSSHAIPVTAITVYNRLYDVIFSVPETREMFRRRMRTVLDAYVKPPGTPTHALPIETKVQEWLSLIADEAARDRAKWGYPPYGGQNNFNYTLDVTNGVQELLNGFLAVRRQHFYGKHSVTNTALPVGIDRTQNAGIPLAQPSNAIVSISGWDYNPASGNQNEEYVLLTNANAYAVDISGWKLDGGMSHTLQPGTVIPSGGSLYLTPDTRAFRNRQASPHGGMALFVQGGCNGHLNAWGESLTLTDNASRLVSSNSFVGAPSLAQQFLRVTEIMYNPAPAPALTNDPQQFEYVEVRNTSTNVTLDLRGVRFTNGIYFNFTGSATTNLPPGQRVVLVRNTAMFTARYGVGAIVAGQYAGALDSNGETLRLEDANGEKILEFAYNNSWYPITDGLGFSLVIVNDLAHWSTWGSKVSWRASGELGGTPGFENGAAPAIAPVLVNEVLTHTDPPLVDAIELFNPATTNVDLGGWFLTDDFYAAKKYRIPNGTTIAGRGYLVLYADSSFDTGANPFLLSEYGESACLFSGDAQTNLTGYTDCWDFPAAPNGVSFGRFTDSQDEDHLVLQSANTLGFSNAPPLVGPVVISEIMYHPPDATNSVDNDLDEFIELRNITSSNVSLFCTFTDESGYGAAAKTNTWQLRAAVDYDFPTNLTLAAGGHLLLVGFDPATNATQLAAFRTHYDIPPNVLILGPWHGKLDNSADSIELRRPDRPDLSGPGVFVPYIMVDEVGYRDSTPWPINADGFGSSLQRVSSSTFGNDPANWDAVASTAGQVNNVATNRPPTADSQSVTNAEDTVFNLTLTGADPDGSAFQFVLVLNPLHGTLSGTVPNLAYHPATNYFGPDSLLFVVNDGALTSSVATVDILLTNVNDAPAAGPDELIRHMSQGVSASPNLILANDWDDEGDPLSVIAVTNAAPTGATISLSNNAITYQPPFGSTNTGSFDYTLSDNHGALATGLVSVTVVPDPAVSDVLAITVTNGAAVFVGLEGVPGFTYTVQRATVLHPPDWQNLTVTTADEFGRISVEDTRIGSTNRFYRTVRGVVP
jgi:hypothetical protein